MPDVVVVREERDRLGRVRRSRLRYAVEFEIIAYVLLVIAAVLNQNVFLSLLNRRVREQADEIDVTRLDRHG